MNFDIKKKEHKNKLRIEQAVYIAEVAYMCTNKYLDIPEDYVTDGGFPLGKIWASLQDDYEQNKLAEADIRFLLKLRMKLTEYPQRQLELWLDRADETEGYYNRHGTLSMPNTTLFSDGASMFQWVHHQKKLYKMGELSEYQKSRLEGMGIKWIRPKQLTGWELGYQHAEQYFEENGHLFIPKKHVSPDGFALGLWIQEQKDRYLGLSPYEISEEKIERLEAVGMYWEDLKNAEWDWFVGLLRECIRTMGKPFSIGKNYRYKNYALGEHVEEAIRQYADGSLSAEKERDLRKAGFKFNRVIK